MANPALTFGALHHAALAELRQAQRAARGRRWDGGRIGADEEEGSFFELGQAYGKYLVMSKQLVADMANAPPEYIEAQARRIRDGMLDIAAKAHEVGLPLLVEAAHAVAEAMEAIIDSFAHNFREFWGVPPWVMLAGGAVLVGGTVFGIGYLLTSGGGQALLSGAGGALAGAGSALAKAAL